MDLISTIFVIYLLFLLLIGIVSYRFSKTQEDYFLAGRKLGPWVTAFSERASGESAWLLLALPGAAISIGLGEIWAVFGIIVGIIGSWYLIAEKLRIETEKYNALTIPEYLQPFVSDIAARAQAISRQPYQPFQGQRIADFSEAQRAAMDQVGQLGRPEQLGQASQTYTDIGQAVGTTKAGTFDQAAAEQYMSPYQQAVTDIAIRKAQEEAQRQQGLSALGAAGRGTAGGSRQAVMDAIRLRGLTDTVGDIQAKGSQQAFAMAQQQFERDRQARLAQAERDRRAQFGVASGLAGLGQLQQQTDLQRLAAQQKVGAAEQALEQQQLDQQQQIAQQVEDEAEKTRRLGNLRDLQGMLLEEAGRTTTVLPSKPAQIGAAYDFGSIFRDAGQESFYKSPYAQGGMIETNEELLRLIGGK